MTAEDLPHKHVLPPTHPLQIAFTIAAGVPLLQGPQRVPDLFSIDGPFSSTSVYDQDNGIIYVSATPDNDQVESVLLVHIPALAFSDYFNNVNPTVTEASVYYTPLDPSITTAKPVLSAVAAVAVASSASVGLISTAAAGGSAATSGAFAGGLAMIGSLQTFALMQNLQGSGVTQEFTDMSQSVSWTMLEVRTKPDIWLGPCHENPLRALHHEPP